MNFSIIRQNLIVFLTKFIIIRLGYITTVVAYDPDIKDRNADQHIAYFIVI